MTTTARKSRVWTAHKGNGQTYMVYHRGQFRGEVVLHVSGYIDAMFFVGGPIPSRATLRRIVGDAK